jgi:heme-degrading monooxygenase HmoA
MAWGVFTYTLPSGTELLRQYPEKVPGWVDIVLSAPGAKEFRAYRSEDGKEVMTITEYDTVSAVKTFLASGKYKMLVKEMEKAGCTNFQVRTWDVSPIMAHPMRARAAAA